MTSFLDALEPALRPRYAELPGLEVALARIVDIAKVADGEPDTRR